jgi:DNA-binding XRE family transcriptional regulator
MTNIAIAQNDSKQFLRSQQLNPKPVTPKKSERRHDDALCALGQRVVHARLARNWTQTELAGMADLGLSTVVAVEAGRGGVGMSYFIRILDALGMLEQLDAVLTPAKDDVLVQRGIEALPRRAKVSRRRR